MSKAKKAAAGSTAVAAPDEGLFIVLRSFIGEGVRREREELVDAAGWRNLYGLVEGRYIKEFKGAPVDCPTCDRRFAREAALSLHHKCGAGPGSEATVPTGEDVLSPPAQPFGGDSGWSEPRH